MKILLFILIIFILNACSLDRFVIRQTGTIIEYGAESLYEETDLVLAEQAIASNIKLLEGMLKGDPENEKLLLLTSQALAGYALGFAEDTEPERAKMLYMRACDYALRVIEYETKAFEKTINYNEFEQEIKKYDKSDIEPLFWAAFSWAGKISLSLNDPQSLIDLPKVQVMMNRILELDESYFYGAAHLFFGSIWGSKPRMLGGDPEKAKQHFDKNLELTGGDFLLTYIYYAKYYAVKTLNEELFKELLEKVETASFDILPQGRLFNAIAKKKARMLLAKQENLF